MCACTEPVRIGIGAVCVEYGRPKWPITMLNHTHIPESHKHPWYRIMFGFLFERSEFLIATSPQKICACARTNLGYSGVGKTLLLYIRVYHTYV